MPLSSLFTCAPDKSDHAGGWIVRAFEVNKAIVYVLPKWTIRWIAWMTSWLVGKPYNKASWVHLTLFGRILSFSMQMLLLVLEEPKTTNVGYLPSLSPSLVPLLMICVELLRPFVNLYLSFFFLKMGCKICNLVLLHHWFLRQNLFTRM